MNTATKPANTPTRITSDDVMSAYDKWNSAMRALCPTRKPLWKAYNQLKVRFHQQFAKA